jgi:hypothetical protein
VRTWIVRDLDQRWQLRSADSCSSHLDQRSLDGRLGTGHRLFVRAMLPEISSGSYSRRRCVAELISKATTTAAVAAIAYRADPQHQSAA